MEPVPAGPDRPETWKALGNPLSGEQVKEVNMRCSRPGKLLQYNVRCL